MTRFLRAGSIAMLAGTFLTACLPEAADVVDPATDNGTVNSAPTVSGSAPASAAVGSNYVFTPSATDADGDTLVWSISGQPGDAAFDAATGRLSWTPTAAGTWSNIVIRVSDNQGGTASLPAFSITVTAPAAPVTGTAALRWQAPTQYTDGSSLNAAELAGFRVYHGTSEGNLSRIAELDAASSTLTVKALEQGTHYFAVTAFSTSGTESSFSTVGSKTIL